MELHYWYLFPIGLIISTLSMSAGISGANFWIPVYIYLIKLDPLTSFWLALITMVFGFGSGVVRNIYQRSVNWHVVFQYLLPAIPAAILGSVLTSRVNANTLIFIFGSFIFVYGLYLNISVRIHPKQRPKHSRIFRGVGFTAGFLKGLIATGVGKLIVPCIWDYEKMKHPTEIIGSVVVIIFIVDIVAALTRMNHVFVGQLVVQKTLLLNIMIFVAPSVIIGGQLGPMTIRNTNVIHLKKYISLVLMFVGLLIFSRLYKSSVIN